MSASDIDFFFDVEEEAETEGSGAGRVVDSDVDNLREVWGGTGGTGAPPQITLSLSFEVRLMLGWGLGWVELEMLEETHHAVFATLTYTLSQITFARRWMREGACALVWQAEKSCQG
jgi:hypothetical protein